MTNFQRTYVKAKPKLLNDSSICRENRKLFADFFEHQENKLKRMNNLRQLDNACYNTLYDYVKRFKTVNIWFKNKPWRDLTETDIRNVYNDLEDGKIKNKYNKPYGDKERYYNKILKSKPFEMVNKADLCRKVIEYTTKDKKEVRFITEEDFRKLVENAYKPRHRLLFWLAWDIGENINALIQLKKSDFTRQTNPYTKEPEYRVNLKREILKRSRLQRSEITNYSETVVILDQELSNLKDNDLLFEFDYRNAKKIMDRAVERCKIKCIPEGQKVTWKDLRSGMACDLLKKGYTTDEVNARLGHRPSSDEIDKYVNFLAIDRHTPKKKVQQFEMEKLSTELEQSKKREKIYTQRIDDMQEKLKQIEEERKRDKEEIIKQIANALRKRKNN